jgi:hypothetical protein
MLCAMFEARAVVLVTVGLMSGAGCTCGSAGSSDFEDHVRPPPAEGVPEERVPDAEKGPSLAERWRVGSVSATVAGRPINYDHLPKKKNIVGGAQSMVFVHGQPRRGAEEFLEVRVQGVDLTAQLGRRLIASARDKRKRRSRPMIVVAHRTAEGKVYSASGLGRMGVEVVVERYDRGTFEVHGRFSGTLAASDGTTLEVRDGKFVSRYATAEEAEALEAAADPGVPRADADSQPAPDPA